MQYKIYVPLALRLHDFGLDRIFTSRWVDVFLKSHIEAHLLKSENPVDLLHNTLPNGFLYHLGIWLFDSYFIDVDNLLGKEPLKQWAYLENLFYLLRESGCPRSNEKFDLLMFIDDINEAWDSQSESKFNRRYHRRSYDSRALEIHEGLIRKHNSDLNQLAHLYSINFAERVFHDRQYCEFIAHIIASIYDFQGLPSLNSCGEIEINIVLRKNWPTWVLDTLRARERGRCARCGKSFSELEEEPQIDHIISLAEGGVNDLVNLQLLCEKCNKKKGKKEQRVNSSIPQYLNWSKPNKIWRRSLQKVDNEN